MLQGYLFVALTNDNQKPPNDNAITGCSVNIVFFPSNVSASSAAALVFYLPCVCTHTDTEGKARVRNISKSLEKNTILNEHPVPPVSPMCTS